MWRLLLPWVVAGTGCMPFALPPARLSLGAGPVTGSVPQASAELPLDVAASLRAGLHPLDLADGASDQPFDLGAGYVLDVLSARARRESGTPREKRAYAQGPYLQGAYSPLRRSLGAASLRLGGRADIDLLFLENDSESGVGGSAVLELELGHYVSGPFVSRDDDDSGFVAGVQRGRWAFALFAGGTFRRFDHGGYGGLTAGVSMRLPFVAGIACCAWPSKSGEVEPRRRRAHPRPRLVRRPATPRPPLAPAAP